MVQLLLFRCPARQAADHRPVATWRACSADTHPLPGLALSLRPLTLPTPPLGPETTVTSQPLLPQRRLPDRACPRPPPHPQMPGRLTGMALYAPLPRERQLLLQTVWDLACGTLRWPTFAELDRSLYTRHEIQALDVLREMPPGFLHGIGPTSPMPPSESQEIGLTVAGVEKCQNTREILAVFIEFMQMATRTEKGWEPPTGQSDALPSLTEAEFAYRASTLPAAGRDHILGSRGDQSGNALGETRKPPGPGKLRPGSRFSPRPPFLPPRHDARTAQMTGEGAGTVVRAHTYDRGNSVKV